ncbi:hypothetical protein DV735_g845, partial [Chaetothyriales sp. CBS 134920]
MAVQAKAQDWLLSKVFPWPANIPVNKIDTVSAETEEGGPALTLSHSITIGSRPTVAAAGGDPSGWPTPNWTLKSTELLMDHVGTQTAILSITAPGACIVEGRWDLARLLNNKAAAIRDSNPAKFGFFLTLANVLDTDAALAEIAFGFDQLHADGVCLFTRYGANNTYLGHRELKPIWTELNRRKAVVFVHPTHPVDTNPINPLLPQPLIDYPHETTRTALDMLSNGTLDTYPDVKVILSHAGGSLPYLISRVATPLSIVNPLLSNAASGLTYDKITRGFKRFYYDLALSTSPTVINALFESGVPEDHITYGSDFPYAPPPAYPAFIKSLEDFPFTPDQREKINFRNAQALFPRLSKGVAECSSQPQLQRSKY